MSDFSNMLEQHILQTGLSEIQLAQVTGFSRSYIARLKNGQRISPDTERMTKLFDALNLTAEEYTELWELYLEERLGKEQYGLTKKMLDFLSSFREVSRLKAVVRMEYSEPEVCLVEGSADLKYLIRAMMEQEAARPSGHLRLFLQPECQEVMDALKNGFKINSKFAAEHIVCLEKEKKTDNIRLLQKMIPVILSQKQADYRVYYYYDRVAAHLNSFSLMPYFIITEDCVLNLDYELEHGLIYREPEVRDFFVRRFDQMADGCRPLYERLTQEKELMAYYLQAKEANHFYCIGSQPCLGYLEAAEGIGRYLKGEMGRVAEALKNRIKRDRERMLRQECRVVSYFTAEGIRRLMEEGVLEELPDEMMKDALEPEDRQAALQELIERAEDGFYEPHLIQEKKYRYPGGVMIDAYSFDDVVLYYYAEDMKGCFMMQESSLARLFYEFLEGLRDSVFVCSVEETLQYLKEQLKKN
ncbi:MAG: helix-turn-helix transcriptional regulator [Lachnospiraceae bacterium]|nr:helix-turn-helix transcriptional regulator [Lachnospiraceae bacterium]